jgi:UDP-N-acetylmuramate dehydrogenase
MTPAPWLSSANATGAIARDVRALGVGGVRCDVGLRVHSGWRCGGRAAIIVSPQDKECVSRLLAYFHRHGIPWAVIGGGANLFFDDAGVDVPLIHIGPELGGIRIKGDLLNADAGAWTPAVALRAMRAGLGGVEHIVGIPGAFGGLVLMNGGSLRQGVGDRIAAVEVAAGDGRRLALSPRACSFAYRRSALQASGDIVLGATLRLPRRDRASIRREMLDILRSRRRRFPRDLPNCGSVFVSDPALYASFGSPGEVIERIGMKGAREGDAMVSSKHANFIVNAGNAQSADILRLIKRVRDAVAEHTGHRMRCEVRFMRLDGEVREAHEWLDDPEWSRTLSQRVMADASR